MNKDYSVKYAPVHGSAAIEQRAATVLHSKQRHTICQQELLVFLPFNIFPGHPWDVKGVRKKQGVVLIVGIQDEERFSSP